MAVAAKAQPGAGLVASLGIQLAGIGVFALLANINEQMGTIMVIMMVGLIFGWALIHSAQLSKLVGDL